VIPTRVKEENLSYFTDIQENISMLNKMKTSFDTRVKWSIVFSLLVSFFWILCASIDYFCYYESEKERKQGQHWENEGLDSWASADSHDLKKIGKQLPFPTPCLFKYRSGPCPTNFRVLFKNTILWLIFGIVRGIYKNPVIKFVLTNC
jgi:hypothetical protein